MLPLFLDQSITYIHAHRPHDHLEVITTRIICLIVICLGLFLERSHQLFFRLRKPSNTFHEVSCLPASHPISFFRDIKSPRIRISQNSWKLFFHPLYNDLSTKQRLFSSISSARPPRGLVISVMFGFTMKKKKKKKKKKRELKSMI